MNISQSRFDVAKVPFWFLRDSLQDIYGASPGVTEAMEIVMAEAVRRYVANDGLPPGGEDQLQMFDAQNILASMKLDSSGPAPEDIIKSLTDREWVTVDIPEAGIEPEDGGFFLTPTGIEAGLAVLDRLAPANPSSDPNDRDMEELLLRYFVNDEWAARGAQPLSAIFAQVNRPAGGWRGAFFQKLHTPDEKHALWLILERLVRRRLLHKRQPENDDEPAFEANEQAIRRYFGHGPTGVDPSRDPDAQNQRAQQESVALNTETNESDGEQRLGQPVDVNSQTWTGLTRVRVTHRNSRAISSLIDAALGELSADGNAPTAQARTLLLAAKELTDAPEPPSDIIWDLIQRAGATVGLLDIFFRIFAAIIVASTI